MRLDKKFKITNVGEGQRSYRDLRGQIHILEQGKSVITNLSPEESCNFKIEEVVEEKDEKKIDKPKGGKKDD